MGSPWFCYVSQQWIPGMECPCGCGNTGGKLSFKTKHIVRNCACASCRGKRNRQKGQRGQREMHQRLGGQGWTPSNEETARPYPLTLSVMPESKAGEQIPAYFHKFINSEWFRKALSQSIRAVPVGSGAHPALAIDGKWVLIDLRNQGQDRGENQAS